MSPSPAWASSTFSIADSNSIMTDITTDMILLAREGPLAMITLNRPEKLNALTKPMWQRLGEAARAVADMDDVRCVILRGAGDQAFAPGNDISEFPTERANIEQAEAYGKI